MSAWYCIRTTTRQEQRVVDGLKDMAAHYGLEFDVYLPCETRWNRLTRVKTIKQVPMLPGYLFIKVSPDHLWRVDKVEGVYQILGWSERRSEREAVKITGFVTELRDAQAAGLFDRTQRNCPKARHNLQKGQAVRVTAGSFGGFIAEIVALSGVDRIRVLLSIFGRQTLVEIAAKEVEPQDRAPAEAA